MHSALLTPASTHAAIRACTYFTRCPQGPSGVLFWKPAYCAVRCRRRSALRAARSDDEVEAVPPAMLSRLESEEEMEAEAGWVASMIECWLNEEWPAQELLQVHKQLAATTGQVSTATALGMHAGRCSSCCSCCGRRTPQAPWATYAQSPLALLLPMTPPGLLFTRLALHQACLTQGRLPGRCASSSAAGISAPAAGRGGAGNGRPCAVAEHRADDRL
ncbi:hypothetical protein ABPG77_002281 [Micractinium sp. CCAP 211/92]